VLRQLAGYLSKRGHQRHTIGNAALVKKSLTQSPHKAQNNTWAVQAMCKPAIAWQLD